MWKISDAPPLQSIVPVPVPLCPSPLHKVGIKLVRRALTPCGPDMAAVPKDNEQNRSSDMRWEDVFLFHIWVRFKILRPSTWIGFNLGIVSPHLLLFITMQVKDQHQNFNSSASVEL